MKQSFPRELYVTDLFQNIEISLFVLDDELRVLFLNDFALKQFNLSADQSEGTDFFALFPHWESSILREKVSSLNRGESIRPFDLHDLTTEKWYSVSLNKGETGILIQFQDFTERRNIEATLQINQKQFAEIGNLAKVGGWEVDLIRNKIIWSQVTREIHEVEDDFEPDMESALSFYPGSEELLQNTIKETVEGKGPWRLELPFVTAKGNHLWSLSLGRAEFEDGVCVRLVGAFQDITQLKKDQMEKQELEERLFHSQKLESIGRLAGGVAHDFNNLLMGIMNFSELALFDLESDHPARESIQQVIAITERSAGITKQLLAFARKQTIQPKCLDLNETISVTLKMLQTLIGEGIHLRWVPGQNLWNVRLDASQIDQILTNLAMNARDAMKGSGELTITTSNQTLSEAFCSQHPETYPGDFVRIDIQDNGMGMDAEQLEIIFEPFYTSKEDGKGTGLGLATVYGIVTQNNGFVLVDSEPGTGTCFSVYFQQDTECSLDDEEFSSESPAEEHNIPVTETILLVEDEPAILTTISMFLTQKGYHVISAPEPLELLQKLESFQGRADLLISDVIMPNMHGKELSKKVNAVFPEIKILFISGYTANIIEEAGVLQDDVFYLPKPFSCLVLDEKLQEILHSPDIAG